MGLVSRPRGFRDKQIVLGRSIDQPRKAPVEADGAAIRDAARMHDHHCAPQDPRADDRAVLMSVQLEFDPGAWEQSVGSLDQRAACGHVDHPGLMTRADTSTYDPVMLGTEMPPRTTTVGRGRYSGVHVRLRALNVSTRVLPVSPKMRITYCAFPRPRM
jgi:hypothetical protein